MNQSSNQLFKLVCLLSVIVFLGSCRSYKNLDVLRELDGSDIIRKDPPKYVVKSGDNLFVSIVTADEELNRIYNPAQAGIQNGAVQVYSNLQGQYVYGFEVASDGTLTLPVIGKVDVGGTTLAETERAVEAKAREFLREMSVKVRLLNYKVTVIGEVNQPGVYFNYNSEFTILDALSTAGGFTNFANLNEVKVIRPTANGDKVFVLDLQDESAISSEAFFTLPNDIITVSPAKNKNLPLKAPAITLVLAAASTALLLINVIEL